MVRNWVDAWVYGFYRASATMPPGSDTPVPDYEKWPNLCDANLQNRITMGAMNPEGLLRNLKLQQPFPNTSCRNDFGQFWTDAFADAYGPPTPNGPVSVASLNHAYHMTWLVLWFQTSGEVVNWFECHDGHARPICTFKDPPTPPDGCTLDPKTVDPFQKTRIPKADRPAETKCRYCFHQAQEECALITQIIGAIVGIAASAGAGIVLIAIGTATMPLRWTGRTCDANCSRSACTFITGFRRSMSCWPLRGSAIRTQRFEG